MNAEEFRNDAMEKKDKSSGMLTADEVATTKGFEHLTRKQVEEDIEGLTQFSVLAIVIFSKIEGEQNNQVDIPLKKAS